MGNLGLSSEFGALLRIEKFQRRAKSISFFEVFNSFRHFGPTPFSLEKYALQDGKHL
jgi:hypothetical protein